MRSRRDFLRLAGAATAPAALLSACGGGGSGSKSAPKPSRGEIDARLLNRILGFEHAMIAAYRTGTPLLHGTALAAARRFLDQEREHAAVLARAIRDLGGTPVESKSTAEYRREFPLLRRQADVLRFAVDLENRVVRAYVESIPKISTPELRQTAAAILTTDAAHVSVLLGERGLQEVPNAFVTGTAQGG